MWPQIDGWLRQFDEGINEPDLAGQGFLKLLKRPRTIYLQDSVLLRRRFPKHALFATPEYAEFSALVNARVPTVLRDLFTLRTDVIPVPVAESHSKV